VTWYYVDEVGSKGCWRGNAEICCVEVEMVQGNGVKHREM